VHQETVDIVDKQMQQMDEQLQALDDIVCRVRAQNGRDHDTHVQSLNALTENVSKTYSSITSGQSRLAEHTRSVEKDLNIRVDSLATQMTMTNQDMAISLADLRSNIQASAITEYISTGETPQKVQYHYQTSLPRTDALDMLTKTDHLSIVNHSPGSGSPTQLDLGTIRFHDETQKLFAGPISEAASPTTARVVAKSTPQGGLRELDVNVSTSTQVLETLGPIQDGNIDSMMASKMQPPTKRQNTGIPTLDNGGAGGLRKAMRRTLAEGRENIPPIRSTRSSRSRAS